MPMMKAKDPVQILQGAVAEEGEETEEKIRHYRRIMSCRLLSPAITNSVRFNDKRFAGFQRPQTKNKQPVIPIQYPAVGINY